MNSKKKKPSATLNTKIIAPTKRPIWIWILPAMVIVAAISLVWFQVRHKAIHQTINTPSIESPEATLASLSKESFSNAEKPVREKLRLLVQEVNDNPSSAHAWGKLAMNLDVHDLKNEAMICYKKAAEMNPSDTRWQYYQAALLYERGATEECLKYFEKSINLKPEYVAARLRYGQALLELGRLEQAAHEFLEATKLDPNSSHGYLGLARISLAQGQLRDCGSLLQKAIQVNPRHGEAYGLMSEVYRRLNQPQKARVQLLISQQLPKKTPVPDSLMTDLFMEGVSSYWYDLRGRAALDLQDYTRAESEFKMAAQLSPSPDHFDTLGAVYLYESKFPEAVAAHRRALELNPNSTAALNNLAAALYETGQHAEAFQTLEKAIQIDPKLFRSYLHLGRLKQRSGDIAAAIQSYRLGLQHTQNSDIALQLSWLLATASEASLRNGQEAVRLAEMVASRDVNADVFDILGVAYAEAGYFDRAIQAEQKALSLAEASNRKQLIEQIQARLKIFRAHRAYREP
jgi:tetratricopeptide (TPR) repeat protein